MTELSELEIEDKILIYLVRMSINSDSEVKVRELIENEVNWDKFLYKASHHGLTPMAFFILKNYFDIVPENVSNFLSDYYFENTKKNLLFLGELTKVIEIFDKNGINIIPYKGLVLAIIAYNNISLREFGDIDLHINLEDIQKVKKIMHFLGYNALFQLENPQEEAYFKFQREYKFKNRYNHVVIEIKWKFFVPSFSFQIDPDVFFISQTEKMDLAQATIETITAENLILLLSIHNASHYWPKLSYICDISRINSKKELNWVQIENKASILGFKRVLYINLLLARNLVGLELPDEISLKLDNDKSANLISKKIQDKLFVGNYNIKWFEKIYLRIWIRENNINKIKDFFKLIFHPTTDVILSISLPNFLYSGYYLLRIFQLIRNYILNIIFNQN